MQACKKNKKTALWRTHNNPYKVHISLIVYGGPIILVAASNQNTYIHSLP
jgi:hypothetical protein